MRATVVLIVDVLADDVVEMRLSEDDEVVKRRLLDALNPTFNKCIQGGSTGANGLDLDSTTGECGSVEKSVLS